MSKFIKKTAVLTILLALAVIAVSCGSENPPDGAGEGQSPGIPDTVIVDGDGTGNAPREFKSPVPDGLDFSEYTVRFYSYYMEYAGDGSRDPARMTIIKEEEAGEVVSESIYRRNMEVMQKLNVNFDFTFNPPDSFDDQDNNNRLARLMRTNDDEFDIVIGIQFQVVQMATRNAFHNIIDFPFLDITNPWWATDYIDELTVGNNVLLFATGDISGGWLSRLSTMYFNFDLYRSYFGEPDELYRLVLDGGWTLDAMSEKVRGMWLNLEGGGSPGDGDQFGLVTHTISPSDHFTYASGVRATARDDQGVPYFVFNSEKTMRYVDKIFDLYFNNPGTYIVPSSHSRFSTIFAEKFAAGEVLFRADTLGISESMRAQETDFGMIPFPKLDENEPGYLSLVHDTAPLMCVPITVPLERDELIGAVLEEMAFRGFMHMTPAFFDIALKNKYMRDSDDMAMQMLDIIRENSTTDFAYVYNYALSGGQYSGGMGLLMRDLLGDRNSNFVSAYDRIIDRSNDRLQSIINAYLG
jgi:hypothetical protein